MNKRIKNKKLSQLLKTIKKINLNPNDTIIIESGELISATIQTKVKEWLQGYFPNNKVLVLQKGFKVSVINEEVVNIEN